MSLIKGLFPAAGATGIAAQIIGFFAMALLIASFQKNSQKGILRLQMASGALWAVHYAMIGAYTGMALNIVSVTRSFLYSNRETKPWADKPVYPYLFFTVSAAAGLLTWQSPASLLPMAAMCLTSFALWSRKASLIRIISVPVSLCWLIFNILSGSYAGILAEVFDLASITAGIIRFDIKKTTKETGN